MKELKRAVAAAKLVVSKNITDQVEQNKSAALECFFVIARQSKGNNKGRAM